MAGTAFRNLVAASGLTNLADGVATVAWAWLASLITRDATLIALVAVMLRIPWFICAVPAGLLADRMDRRRLIVAMDGLRAIGFITAAAIIWAALPLAVSPDKGVSNVWLYCGLIVAALTVGTAEVFRDNAAQTLLPSVVDHQHLERANGRLWSIELIGNALTGPALGAALVAIWLPLPFLFNALGYAVAMALMARVVGNFTPAIQMKSRNWRRELSEGWNFMRASYLLQSLAVITGLWNLFYQMVAIALVLHVQENLGLSVGGYGLILSASAVGGILGGWVGVYIVDVVGPMRTAQIMLFVSAPFYAAIALLSDAWALAAVLVVFQFCGVVWNTVSVSYRQRNIPDRLLGRVNALYRLMAWGMMPIGLLLSGIIVNLFDDGIGREAALRMPFVVAALGAGVLGVVGWRALATGFDRASH
jgi:MFS family permease